MKNILIIDDELDICLLLQAYLQKNNFSVEYSCNLKDGINAIKSHTPDALLLDNNLPDGQGVNKIQNLKSAFPDMKLIMISAMTSIQQMAIKRGADHFVQKPFKLSLINQILNLN